MPHKFSFRQEFSYPLSRVIAARARRYESLEHQDAIKGQRILRHDTDGDLETIHRELTLGSGIPEMVRKLVPENLLQMEERVVYDRARNSSEFSMQNPHLPGKFAIVGKSAYFSSGPASCYREYQVSVTVNYPLIGGMLEAAIAQNFQSSMEKDRRILSEIAAGMDA